MNQLFGAGDTVCVRPDFNGGLYYDRTWEVVSADPPDGDIPCWIYHCKAGRSTCWFADYELYKVYQ